MDGRQLHLVRHGEVENPARVLYGRLPGFKLSTRGEKMAAEAANELAATGRETVALYASPLERAQQSAAPIAQALGLEIQTEERIIEPTNWFEGKSNSGKTSAFKNPKNWYKFWNPWRPSWGEPYKSIARRVQAAMDDAWQSNRDGDTVMVSHQAAIWVTHLAIAGKSLAHNPARRRCQLSSITSFERINGEWREVSYRTPAAELNSQAIDLGAV